MSPLMSPSHQGYIKSLEEQLERVRNERDKLQENFDAAVKEESQAKEMLRSARQRTDPTIEELVVGLVGRKVCDVLECMLRTGLYGVNIEAIVRESLQRTAREFLTSGLPRPGDDKPKHVPLPKPPAYR